MGIVRSDPPDPTSAPTLHVLHVDDSDDDHILLVHCVETIGLPVGLSSATSAGGALHILGRAASLPDLILLDIKLPGTTGLELLTTLKSDTRFSAIPIIMLTNSTLDTDAAEARRLGADGYCVKPGSLSDYKALVTRMYEEWRKGRVPCLWPQ